MADDPTLLDPGTPAVDDPPVVDPNAAPVDEGWFFREGVKGEGDKPDWYDDKKYKSVEDQAKAYPEAAKKLGGFVGAPETYELTLPENVQGDFDLEHPVLKKFQEIGKASGMSQEIFTNLLHQFVEYESLSGHVDITEEKKAIGADADNRLKDANDFLKANLSAEDYARVNAISNKADGFLAIESILKLAKAPKIPEGDGKGASTVTADECRTAKFQKDDQGNLLYETSPEHKKKVDAMYDELYGTDPHSKVVQSQSAA